MFEKWVSSSMISGLELPWNWNLKMIKKKLKIKKLIKFRFQCFTFVFLTLSNESRCKLSGDSKLVACINNWWNVVDGVHFFVPPGSQYPFSFSYLGHRYPPPKNNQTLQRMVFIKSVEDIYIQRPVLGAGLTCAVTFWLNWLTSTVWSSPLTFSVTSLLPSTSWYLDTTWIHDELLLKCLDESDSCLTLRF